MQSPCTRACCRELLQLSMFPLACIMRLDYHSVRFKVEAERAACHRSPPPTEFSQVHQRLTTFVASCVASASKRTMCYLTADAAMYTAPARNIIISCVSNVPGSTIAPDSTDNAAAASWS